MEEDENDGREGGGVVGGHPEEEEVVVVVVNHTQGSDVHSMMVMNRVPDKRVVVRQRQKVPDEKHSRWGVGWLKDCALFRSHMAAVGAPHVVVVAVDVHRDDGTHHGNAPLGDPRRGTRWRFHFAQRACPNPPMKIPREKLHCPPRTFPPNCDPSPNWIFSRASRGASSCPARIAPSAPWDVHLPPFASPGSSPSTPDSSFPSPFCPPRRSNTWFCRPASRIVPEDPAPANR